MQNRGCIAADRYRLRKINSPWKCWMDFNESRVKSQAGLAASDSPQETVRSSTKIPLSFSADLVLDWYKKTLTSV